MALLIAMILHKITSPKPIGTLVLFAIIFSIYSSAFQNRIYRWSQVSNLSDKFYSELDTTVANLSEGSKIYIQSLPSTRYGIPYLSYFSINDSWRYLYPAKRIEIFSDPAPMPEDLTLLLMYNSDNKMLERIGQ
jgi:hypothetical protein